MRLHVTRAARHAAERRLRRTVRAAGIAVAAVGLVAASALAAVPAVATTTTMSLRAVGGDSQITAAWSRVPGATRYTVHWGLGTGTGSTRTTTGASIRIGGVTNLRSYSIRVTADGTNVGSPRRTVRPVPYVPTSITKVTAVPAGPDTIKVTWSGGTQARSFAIIAGSDSGTVRNHFETGWHAAALQSWVITVPARLHDVLGGGSGNAVFVKVVLSNSTAANPVKHLGFNGPDRYCLTPPGTWTFAGAPAGSSDVTRLRVASWNVQSLSASSSFTAKDRWGQRITRVVANIESLHPDLIGLQELGTARMVPTCTNPPGTYGCVEQYQTLQSALSPTSGVATPYLNADEDANRWVYTQPKNAYVDSALFYNPNRLTELASGFLSPRDLMGAGWPSGQSDSAGMWAEFSTTTSPSRTFFAVSLHLPAGSSSAAIPVSALRKAEALTMARWIDTKATRTDGTHVPVVFLGDLNGNGATDSDAGSLQLRHLGYTDAGATSNRTGYYYSTSNATNGTDGPDSGYPVHAVKHPYPTSRIDYIMLKDSPFTYDYSNEVRLVPGSTLFDTRYQGSDHNLQLADIGIADPS